MSSLLEKRRCRSERQLGMCPSKVTCAVGIQTRTLCVCPRACLGAGGKLIEVCTDFPTSREKEARLVTFQSEIDAERTRMHQSVARLESTMKDAQVRNEQERWRLTQDNERLKVRP